MLDVRVEGAEDLRRMARKLRQAHRVDLGRNLSKGLKRAAEPMKRAVQDGALGIETHGFRKPGAKHPYDRASVPKGTRQKIADAVTVDVRVSEENPRMSIRVVKAKLPAELKNMPGHYDSGKKWRHPVDGNRNAWVGQIGKPWFEKSAKDHFDVVVKESQKAIGETRDMLEKL